MGIFFKTKTQASQQTAAAGLNFQSSCYGKVIPIIFGITRVPGNIIWYGDFTTTTTSSPSGGGGGGGGKGGVGGGGGGKGGGGSITYTYSTSFAIALGEGASGGGGARYAYIDKNLIAPSSLGFTDFFGSYSQSPWGYLTTNHPTEALNYHGVSYLAVPNYNLGNSAQLPNFNFEAYGIFFGEMPNAFDTDPTYVIAQLLIDDKFGINLYKFAPYFVTWDFIIYQNYVRAFNFGVSVALLQQQPCADIFNNIVKNTNSEFVWSGYTLKIVPYGDTSKTANGYTYTAPSAPLYSLGDDDFITPVQMSRKRGSDVTNSIKLECLDRNNSYNPATIEAKDQSLIDLYGLRQDSARDGHLFCDTSIAQHSVQLQLQREQVRNIYTFQTGQRYILLDPMDIIEISDSYLGLVNQWVRVKEISEDSSGNLTFTCEEYMGGNGNAPTYSLQSSNGFTADYNMSPGNINTPVIFDAPVQVANGNLETWLAASGGIHWGGCDVWISSDSETYKIAGRITGPSRQGVLTNPFPSGSDPDVTNICSVNLTESSGQLLSGTKLDADLAHTLCIVGSELISYQTASLTSLYNYSLGTYIRRGQFGTTISNHAVGEQFARLDASVFTYPYDKSQIGKTVYIKFLSFNIYGGGEQSLSDVTPYAHTIVGPPFPPDVTGFVAQQNGNAVVFGWNHVTDAALKGYDILYGPQGGSIQYATFLTEGANGTEMTNADVPVGTWSFYIRARDITDRFSVNPSMYNLEVIDTGNVVARAKQETNWLGTLTNCVLHYSGVLVPQGTLNCSVYSQISAPSAPSLSSISGGTLIGATYYVRVTYLNVYGSETDPSLETSLAVSTNNLLVVTSPGAVSGVTGYNVYVSTSTLGETLQNSTPISIGTDWTIPLSGLIPGISLVSTNSTGWEMFNIYVPDPVATASYVAPIIDTGFDDVLTVYSTSYSPVGPGQTGETTLSFSIATWLTGGSDPGTYTPWTSGQLNMRYLKGKITATITPGSVGYISDFTEVIERAPRIENGATVAIAGGGTAVVFPQPYHVPPFVQVTVISGTALIGTAQTVTTTGFIAHVFNTSGSDVGGTINWESKGA